MTMTAPRETRAACPICTADDTDQTHTLDRTGDDLLATKAAARLLSIRKTQ